MTWAIYMEMRLEEAQSLLYICFSVCVVSINKQKVSKNKNQMLSKSYSLASVICGGKLGNRTKLHVTLGYLIFYLL